MVSWGTRPSNDPPAATAYWIERKASCDPLYTGQADPLKPEVKVRIAAVYRLSEIKKAVEHALRGGKVLLDVAEP